MKSYVRYIAIILSLIFSQNSMALTLAEIKAKGYVGEQPNGYLGFVTKAPQEVYDLVNEINKQRRLYYLQISVKDGASLQTVEGVAGEKAINKSTKGNYIRTAMGDWVVK